MRPLKGKKPLQRALTIRFEDTQWARLEQLAIITGKGKADVIRLLLDGAGIASPTVGMPVQAISDTRIKEIA